MPQVAGGVVLVPISRLGDKIHALAVLSRADVIAIERIVDDCLTHRLAEYDRPQRLRLITEPK